MDIEEIERAGMPENMEQRMAAEKTIVAAANDGEIADYQELRSEFHIYPNEDGMKYENFKLLGIGGMGVVYSAADPTLERQVALKILREPFRHNREQIGKFINEARTTAKIDHPNIVSVHQLGLNEHYGVYFSMRKISGETLQHTLRRLRDGDAEARKHYTLRRLLDIFIAGCNGVAAAHAKKILHCDLKPANIMIGNFGEVLVLDWGLAREFDQPLPDGKFISGTPAYMAPELISGTVKAPDEKTEVYALGTILFSILTWHAAPFDLELSNEKIMKLAARGKLLPLRAPKGQKLSKELAAICRKAMAYDREDRYSSVEELLDDLNNYHDGYPVLAYSPNKIYRFFKLCRRHPAIPIAVAVALFTLFIYRSAMLIIDYAHDRSLLHSAEINMHLADDYYRRSVFFNRQKFDPVTNVMVVNVALAHKDLEMQRNLVLMEYRSVIDSASALSPAGSREFTERYGADIFKKMLELHIMNGKAEEMSDFVDRFKNREIFQMACVENDVLRSRIEMVKSDTGRIRLKQREPFTVRSGYMQSADGSRHYFEMEEELSLKMPSGENYFFFEDGLRMKFRIMPGCDEIIDMPEIIKDDDYTVIPGDHFYMELPEISEFYCRMDSFMIRRAPLAGRFTHEEAENLLREMSKNGEMWRLPHLMEMHKVLNGVSESGEGFYGTNFAREGYILLANDLFYDLKSCRSVTQLPEEQSGWLLPVRTLY